MKFQGALIKEQGVTFAVIIVKRQATQSDSEFQEAHRGAQLCFPGIPVVLASQDSSGRFEYRGRRDLVNFLASVHPSRIPWREYETRA